ncbi:MAG: hypothetical protein J6D16_07240 [Clostridia bacterium]|nr:hypothetical protein [Clostridia bacterium]
MVNSEEKQKFEKICLAIQNTESGTLGIGTLGEKTLHRVLKTYLCPDSDYHEVGIGPFVADALEENTLYEIQSAGLFPLKKKLAYYLANTDKKVQIVCPILTAKRLIWVDPESGTLSESRKVPVGHGKMRVLPEMIYLLEHLDFDRVCFLIVGLTADDYKLLDGKGTDKKHGATRLERIPRELVYLRTLSSREDIADFFLPEALPTEFTSAEFSRLTNLRRRTLSAALKVLLHLNILEIAGKQKKAIYYRKIK